MTPAAPLHIEAAADLVFTLDDGGRFIYVNQSLSDYTGRVRGEWLGRAFSDLIDEEDRPLAEAKLSRALEGGAVDFEARLTGSPYYFSTKLNPFTSATGERGIVGIARDVTESFKVQQELTELKNFNESIIQSMQSGLITIDLKDRITSFNSGAEEALKYSRAEVLNRPLVEIMGERATAILLQRGSAASLSNREVTVTTKSGEEVHIGFTLTPRLDEKSRQAGNIILFRDISQIKRMQVEVLRMDRLASLGVLASGIAHEIKNPLAGIKTMAQTLEEDLEGEDPRKIYLYRIIRQVNRLDELLKAFFDYARPRPPMRKKHRVQEVLHEVLTLVDQKMNEKNILWSEKIDDNLAAVFVDFHQIQQVFLNLILNAMDAMEQGGVLEIEARPVQDILMARPRRKSSFIEVVVSDTGGGIAPENLERIFDPFFTTKPQGTGLGLSIVHRIVTAHYGKIRVESAPGKGTRFRVLLPEEEVVA